MLKKSLGLISVLALTACASAPKLLLDDGKTSLLQAKKIYTQTNLHPDTNDGSLSSLNYQKDGLIPRCTEVEVIDIDSNTLLFRANNKEFEFSFDERNGSFGESIQQYFGASCQKSALSKLNPVDKKGLDMGQVYKGMSKKGVLLAIGYPPKHQTPTVRDKVWKYWLNSEQTFSVLFDDNGIVKYIKR